MPSAAEVPAIETHWVATPSPRNPLGAKGVGEIGMIAAPAAVHNAVLDALSPLGVRHLDVPCTPEVVWRAIQEGATGYHFGDDVQQSDDPFRTAAPTAPDVP